MARRRDIQEILGDIFISPDTEFPLIFRTKYIRAVAINQQRLSSAYKNTLKLTTTPKKYLSRVFLFSATL